MDLITNERKKINLLKRFQNVEYNSNNYGVGGGLNGGMSNRNFNAKNDAGKLTLANASKDIANVFNIDKEVVKDILKNTYDLEWHHAGFLPKSYGGGMKKVYYVNSDQIVEVVNKMPDLIAAYYSRIEARELETKQLQEKQIQIEKFEKRYGTPYTREETEPKFSVRKKQEMNGKYGWFDSSTKSYYLTEYYSGISFKSQKTLDKYYNLINH